MISDYKSHLDLLPSRLEITNENSGFSLHESYQYCLDIFKLHAKSFHFASRYLDEEERKSIAALYAFCRLTDDFADETDLTKEEIEIELDTLDDIIDNMAEGVVFDHP